MQDAGSKMQDETVAATTGRGSAAPAALECGSDAAAFPEGAQLPYDTKSTDVATAVLSHGTHGSAVAAGESASAVAYTVYTYDDDNQLIAIDGYTDTGTHYTRAYTYDAFGRRISATEDGVTRYFAFDGLDVIAELSQVSSFEFQVSKHYARGAGLGGGIGDVIAIWDPASGIRYPSYNHRGDVVTMTDASGSVNERNEYTAFGEPVSGIWNPASGITNPASCILRSAFSSKEFDTASGLTYYGFRYYDPASVRWMNKEPSGADGPNQYWFVWNAPVQLLDFLGLEAIYPPPVPDSPGSGYSTVTYVGIYWHYNRYNSVEDCICAVKDAKDTFTKCVIVDSLALSIAAIPLSAGASIVVAVVGAGAAWYQNAITPEANELCNAPLYIISRTTSPNQNDENNLGRNHPPKVVSQIICRHPVMSAAPRRK